MPTLTTSSPQHNPPPVESIAMPLTGLAVAGGVILVALGYWVRQIYLERKLPSGNQSGAQSTPTRPCPQVIIKQRIPDTALQQHQKELQDLQRLVQMAEQLDSEKFHNREFSIFSKIKTYIDHNVYEYADLNYITELINVAIEAQKSFTAIYTIESQFYSKKQQEFYHFVTELLYEDDISGHRLQQTVTRQAKSICQSLQSAEGKDAIQAYASEVAKVAEHEFGINLLRLFKKNQMSDYGMIGSIRDSIDRLEGSNLVDLDGLMMLVLEKSHIFEKIGAVLDLKDEANSAETHRKILQFIGLKQRYQSSYDKFQRLLAAVKDFHRYYQAIATIREQYPADTYRLPRDFTAELPGLKLYKKYVIMAGSHQDSPIDKLTAMATKAAAKNDEGRKLFKNSWDRQRVAQMGLAKA